MLVNEFPADPKWEGCALTFPISIWKYGCNLLSLPATDLAETVNLQKFHSFAQICV